MRVNRVNYNIILKINRKSIFSLGFLLWPILNTYGFITETIGVGDILLIILSIISFFNINVTEENKSKMLYIRYFIFAIFISFVAYAFTVTGNKFGIALSLTRRIVYVFLFSVFAPGRIDFEIFLRQYKRICAALSLVVFIQVLLRHTTGYSEPFIINSSIFPVREVSGYTNYMINWHIHLSYEAYKAPSLFSEASKYAHYVVPCLLLLLINNKHNGLFIFELFISIALVLTYSANAVVFMIVAWCTWILFARKNRHRYTKVFVSIVGILSLVYLFTGVNWFTVRLSEIGNGLTSGSMRVLRGWIIYGMLPTVNKLLGVGIGNVASYIALKGIRTGFDAGYLGYMSGLSEVAVSSGLICLIAYLFVFLIYFIRCGETGKCLVLVLMVMLMSSAILDTPTYGISIMLLEKLSWQTVSINEV